jgi:branched-chain amino acid transport system permease protein
MTVSRWGSVAAGVFRRTPAALVTIGVLAVATLIATTTQSAYNLYIFDSILLACIGAISLQVLQGAAGLVSVGNAAFLLLGALSAVFALRAGLPFPIDIFLAAAVGAGAGFISGLPALRLRALFLGLATLATHFIAIYIGNLYEGHVASAKYGGFSLSTLFGSRGLLGGDRDWAWLLFGIVSVIVLGAFQLTQGRAGRAMRMLREHELTAPTMGISVSRYKLILFALSSAFVATEGALLAHFTGSVDTGSFTLLLAFQYIAMIIIGGLDSINGAIIGAIVVIGLPAGIPNIVSSLTGHAKAVQYGPNIALIIYGVLVVFFVTSSPGGVIGLIKSLTRRLNPTK